MSYRHISREDEPRFVLVFVFHFVDPADHSIIEMALFLNLDPINKKPKVMQNHTIRYFVYFLLKKFIVHRPQRRHKLLFRAPNRVRKYILTL